MTDVLVGLLCICVGLLLVMRGSLVLRLLMALWAAFAGFVLGAGVVAASTGDSFLAGALALGVATATGLVFGLVAYVYYALAIVFAMAAFGFTLGADLLVALGVTWTWLVVLGGVVLGMALATMAVLGDLPMVVLVVLSSLAGASTVITGLMLLFGAADVNSFDQAVTTQRIEDDWWWYVIYLGLAVVGMVGQIRLISSLRAPVRHEWSRPARQSPARQG
jgi:hypothetical protein